MDGEDPRIPALVPRQRPFFLPHSFLFSFTQVYKPEQGLALPGFRRMFASVPVKARYHPPSCKIHQLLKQILEKMLLCADSFSANVVETMFCTNDWPVLV